MYLIINSTQKSWLHLLSSSDLCSSAHFFAFWRSLVTYFHLLSSVCGILGCAFLCIILCSSVLSPSMNLCFLFMQMTFKSLWLCLHLSGWESCPAVFPWEWSVTSKSSAWLKDMLMFSLHQGGSTFLVCLSLKPTFYLFFPHTQVYLSWKGRGSV